MEISVTFSSHPCNKTTVITYFGKTVCSCLEVCVPHSPSLPPSLSFYIYSTVEGVLTSVYLRSRTLVIESRYCISSPQNYRILVSSTDTPSTPLVNVSFNPSIEYDVEDILRPNTQYTIRVQLVEASSNTIIDEKTTHVMYTAPSVTVSTPG